MGIADLTTHQNVLNAALGKARSGLTERAGVTEVTVAISAGLQAGQSRRISASEFAIGSDESNDLIMLDSAVAGKHVTTSFQRSAFGTLIDVTALSDGVSLGRQPLATGETRNAMRLPVEIGIGENQITFEREDGRHLLGPVPHQRNKLDTVVLFALCSIVFLFLGYFLLSSVAPKRTYAVEVTSNTEMLVPAVAIDAEWVALTNAKAAAFNLDNEIEISQQSNNLIHIYGRIPESKLAELRELQIWVDKQPNAPTFVWDVRRQAALNDMPPIAMILTSEPRRLVLANGQIKPVGDTLVEDWIVSDIGDKALTVARGSEEITITYESLLQ